MRPELDATLLVWMRGWKVTKFLHRYWLPMALGAMLWTLAIYLVGIAFAQPISTFVRKGGDFWNGPMVSLYKATANTRPSLEIRNGTANIAAISIPQSSYFCMDGTAPGAACGIYFQASGTNRIVTTAKTQYANTSTSVSTPGTGTINAATGISAFAAAGTSATITNNYVTTNSKVFAINATNDATGRITSCVPAAGSFTCNTVATTGITNFVWWVVDD